MKEIIQNSGLIIAGLLPIYLIVKWRHWGLLASVLIGWILVYVISTSFQFEDKVEAVFAGVWMMLGWAYMLAWTLPIYGLVLLFTWLKTRKRNVGSAA